MIGFIYGQVIRQVPRPGTVEAYRLCNFVRRPTGLALCLRNTSQSGSSKIQLTEGEKLITAKLKEKFPGAKQIEVSDISGGCGAMYQISIEAEEFQGKKTVMQHRLVNEISDPDVTMSACVPLKKFSIVFPINVLAEEIKNMHGLQLNTKAPGS